MHDAFDERFWSLLALVTWIRTHSRELTARANHRTATIREYAVKRLRKLNEQKRPDPVIVARTTGKVAVRETVPTWDDMLAAMHAGCRRDFVIAERERTREIRKELAVSLDQEQALNEIETHLEAGELSWRGPQHEDAPAAAFRQLRDSGALKDIRSPKWVNLKFLRAEILTIWLDSPADSAGVSSLATADEAVVSPVAASTTLRSAGRRRDMSSQRWSLDEALAWVTWRDEDSVRRVGPGGDWTYKKLLVNRNLYGNPADDAYRNPADGAVWREPRRIGCREDLYQACAIGKVKAWGRFNGGRKEVIPRAEWSDGALPQNWTKVTFDPREMRRVFRAPDTPQSVGTQPLTEGRAKTFAAKYIKDAEIAGRTPSLKECETQAQTAGYQGGRDFLRNAYKHERTVTRGRPKLNRPNKFAKK